MSDGVGGRSAPRRRGGPGRALTAVVGTLGICATLLGAASPATAAARRPPSLPHTKPVPVTDVASHYHRAATLPRSRPAPVSWPTGRAQLSVPASGSPAARTAADTDTTAPATRATAAPARGVQAGSLPVWVAAAGSATASPKAKTVEVRGNRRDRR